MQQFTLGPAPLCLLGRSVDGPVYEPVILNQPDHIYGRRYVEEATLTNPPYTLQWDCLNEDIRIWKEEQVTQRDVTNSTLRAIDTYKFRAQKSRLVPDSETVTVDGTAYARVGSSPGALEYTLDYGEGVLEFNASYTGAICTMEYQYRSSQWIPTSLPMLQFSTTSILTFDPVDDIYLLDYRVTLATYDLLAGWDQAQFPESCFIRVDDSAVATAFFSPFTIEAVYGGSQYNTVDLHWINDTSGAYLRIDLSPQQYRPRSMEWHFSEDSALAAGQTQHYPTYQALWNTVNGDSRVPLRIDYPIEYSGSLCTTVSATLVTLSGGVNHYTVSDSDYKTWLASALDYADGCQIVCPVGVSCSTHTNAPFEAVANFIVAQIQDYRDKALVVANYGDLAAVQTKQAQDIGVNLVVVAGTVIRNIASGYALIEGAGPAVAGAMFRQTDGLLRPDNYTLYEDYTLEQLRDLNANGVLALHRTWGRGLLAYTNTTVARWNPLHIRALQQLLWKAKASLEAYVGSHRWEELKVSAANLLDTWRQNALVRDVRYSIYTYPTEHRAEVRVSVLFYEAIEYINTVIRL